MDGFPKNQRFILGLRFANDMPDILELFNEPAGSRDQVRLLEHANRKPEILRRLLRSATDRKVLTGLHDQYACDRLNDTGRSVGGWLRQQRGRTCDNGRRHDSPYEDAGQAPAGPVGTI